MNPFTERTEEHPYTTWADINWHAVEEQCTTPARTYLSRHHEQGMEEGQKPPEAACSSHVQQAPGDPTYHPGKPGQTHGRD